MMERSTNQPDNPVSPNRKKRGFASMSPEKRKEIASRGGRSAQEKGKAFKFDSDTARVAGRIGGRVVSENKDHMAEIGRKGGEASARSKGYELISFPERTHTGT